MTAKRDGYPDNDNKDADDTDRLAALIMHKLRLLEQLVDLSRKQQELIGLDDLDSLLALLSNKQRLVEGLQQVERALDPFRAQDPDQRNWRTLSERAVCRKSAERCEQLLTELLANERRATGELADRRQQAESRLQGFDTMARAQSAYAAHAPPARRLDLSSS